MTLKCFLQSCYLSCFVIVDNPTIGIVCRNKKMKSRHKEMTTKFDVEKFLRDNYFGLWKLKRADKGCGKGKKIAEELKSFNGDAQQ